MNNKQAPRIYAPKDHGILRQHIDKDALTVLEALRAHQHQAYIVGGGVRDLLCGIRPKDFDISTSATPQEVKNIFRRQCLLIGRRFRLAHVRFGNKIIEVATFRSGENSDDLIVRDNEFGNAAQDARRRDLTINGLFYDSVDETIIDYVGGFEDAKLRLLRVIGDPILRYRQDPVRMLRLLKFSARLGFAIDPLALDALLLCRDEIQKSSPARLLEELLRMIESGSSGPFFSLMQSHKLLELLLPSLANALSGNAKDGLTTYFAANDAACQKQQKPQRSSLVASFLYPLFEQKLIENDVHDFSLSLQHVDDIISEYLNGPFLRFPKRLAYAVSFSLITQLKLTPDEKRKKTRSRFLLHPDFASALFVLEQRASINETLQETFDYWKSKYVPPQAEESSHAPRKRRRKRKKHIPSHE